jgi:nucleotide-binding universal stress UspA family protein
MTQVSYLKILVPIAGPVPAKDKAERVMRLASRLRAEILALHIVKCLEDNRSCVSGREALEIFEDAALHHGIKISSYLKEGELLETIIEFAEEMDVDLIVMGASEDGRMIAEWIVSDLRYKTDLPVVIEPHGFVTITTEI